MINACVVLGRKSGYSNQSQKVSDFLYPFEEPDLLALLIKFVNRENWTPRKNIIIFEKHFKIN